MKRNAIFPGTFDPWTTAHQNVLAQAVPLFDKVTIAIATNADKHPMLSWEELIEIATGEFKYQGYDVDVCAMDGCYCTVDYAAKHFCNFLIRGIRNTSDFVYEQSMAYTNLEINPSVQTVFFAAAPEFVHVSSSMVRGLIGTMMWQPRVQNYIPSAAWESFKEMIDKRDAILVR